MITLMALSVIMLALYVAVFISDIVSFFVPFAGKMGVVMWYLSFIPFVLIAITALFDMIRLLLKRFYFVGPLTLLIFIVIILVSVGDPHNISGETTQEMRCVLDQLFHASDSGFRGTCLFGYPARQFFVPAIPSVLFGRSQIALNIGGSIYFLVGMLIFMYGVRSMFRDNRIGDILSGIFVVFLFHVNYFNYLLLNFEQSFYPVSFSLMLVGLLLLYVAKKRFYLLVVASLLMLYMIYSYTPSLALVVLGLLTGVRLIPKQAGLVKKLVLGILIGMSVAGFGMSLVSRTDVTLAMENTPLVEKYLDYGVRTVRHIFTNSEGAVFLSPFANGLFIILVAAGLAGLFGLQMAIVIVWIVATIIFSVAARGYGQPAFDFAFHRATFVFPVLFGVMVSYGIKMKSLLGRHTGWLYLLYVLLLFSGLYYFGHRLVLKEVNTQVLFIRFVEKPYTQLLTEKEHPLLVFDYNLADTSYIATHDFSQYFLDKMRTDIMDTNCAYTQNYGDRPMLFATLVENQFKSNCVSRLQGRATRILRFYSYYNETIDLYRVDKY